MPGVLLDANTWSSTLLRSSKLSRPARKAIKTARTRFISAALFYEVSQKVRLGKWPQMAPFASNLQAFAIAQGPQIADLDAEICIKAGFLEWTHRDPFDRIIAAAALHYGLPIVSSDAVFDGIVARIW